jgi:predicted component of type VI protein secretion system
MDDPRRDAEAAGRPVQGPHWRHGPPPAPTFVGLRLILHPGGQVFECGRPDLVIGRHSGADVRLPLPDVSRRHCRLVCADGTWQVIDLNSLNGVYVNGEKVRQATLHHHDLLRVGGFVMEVSLQPGQAAPAPGAGGPAPDGVLRSIAEAFPDDDELPPATQGRVAG